MAFRQDASLHGVLNEVADALFGLLMEKFETMPRQAAVEDVWKMMAEMSNGLFGIYIKLAKALTLVSPDCVVPSIPASNEISAKEVLEGLQRRSQCLRNDIFNQISCSLPPPVINNDPEYTSPILEKVIISDSDCFLSLSSLMPGCHGWIIVFRDELKDRFLTGKTSFRVIYEDNARNQTYFGVYTAKLLPRTELNGAEFINLSDSTREAIVSGCSQSEKGTKAYNDMNDRLLLSLSTPSCFFLQCLEHQPNLTIDVDKPPTQKKNVPARPPGLPSPPPFRVKTNKREVLGTTCLPGNSHNGQVAPAASHMTRHNISSNINQFTKLNFGPVHVKNDRITGRTLIESNTMANVRSAIGAEPPTGVVNKIPLTSSSSESEGRWYNVENAENIPNVPLATLHHRNWRDHQNIIQANVAAAQRLGPRPFQPNMENNIPPSQFPLASFSQKSHTYHPQIPQHPFHGASWQRGYQVQNQNINPNLWNPPLPRHNNHNNLPNVPPWNPHFPPATQLHSLQGTKSSRPQPPPFYRAQNMR